MTMMVQLAIAVTQPPMKNHQPYIVLWKCGSRDIDKSHDKTIQPNAKAKPRNTASFPCNECVECSSRRSSRNPLRIRSRRLLAQLAPDSGRIPTSSRTDV